MNNFMADLFEVLNAFTAFCGIILSIIAGVLLFNEQGALMAIGTVLGGIILTVMICGFTAVVIDIRHKLYRIA